MLIALLFYGMRLGGGRKGNRYFAAADPGPGSLSECCDIVPLYYNICKGKFKKAWPALLLMVHRDAQLNYVVDNWACGGLEAGPLSEGLGPS